MFDKLTEFILMFNLFLLFNDKTSTFWEKLSFFFWNISECPEFKLFLIDLNENLLWFIADLVRKSFLYDLILGYISSNKYMLLFDRIEDWYLFMSEPFSSII